MMRSSFLVSAVVIVAMALLGLSCGRDRQPVPPETPPEAPPETPRETTPEAPPGPLPDLVITGVVLTVDGQQRQSGDILPSGAACKFHVRVTNQGEGAVPTHATVMVKSFGPFSGYSGSFGGLNPGESKVAEIMPMEVRSPGTMVTVEIGFTVDPDNVLAESDEQNNDSGTFVVKAL